MMTKRATSKDLIMRSKGENKTVLSWNKRSLILYELRDRRSGLGLSKHMIKELEKYQFPNLANADPCLARSSLFKSLTFSSFLVIIPRPNTIIPILGCSPHPNNNVSQSQKFAIKRSFPYKKNKYLPTVI